MSGRGPYGAREARPSAERGGRDKIVVRQGISALSALGLLFVAGKMFGGLAWPWWQVLLPFYIVPAVIVAVLIAALAFVLVCVGLEMIADFAIRKLER